MADRVRLTNPTPAGANGRDPTTGKFLPGNHCGVGNPLSGHTQRIRAILLGSLTDLQAEKIAKKLIKMALGGDIVAIRELLDRTVGKSTSFEVLDRLEKLESLIEERSRGN